MIWRFRNTVKILILTVLSFSLSSCEVDDIEVGAPKDVQVEELNMSNISLLILLPINNYNNFSFKIKGVDLDVYINGRKLGNINKIEQVKVPKKSNDVYPVRLNAKPSDALMSFVASLSDLQKGRARIRLHGSIKVGKFLALSKIKVNHEQVFELY